MVQVYHLGVKSGDIAPHILLCGDPARAAKVANRFDKVVFRAANREFITYTGFWHNLKISVIGTGIGPDNTEICIVELSQVVKNATIIRLGSSGALQKYIKLGELIISTASMRLENTSLYFVEEGFPAVANHEVIFALEFACSKLGINYYTGITASAPGFYGAQGRSVGRFKPRFPGLTKRLASLGILNLEMETSSLFTMATLAGFRAGALCSAYANRITNKFLDAKGREKADKLCIDAGLLALEILAQYNTKK